MARGLVSRCHDALLVVVLVIAAVRAAERGEDLEVFVNADLLKPGHGLTVRDKLGVGTWEECASSCAEHTCCMGFVFYEPPDNRPLGTCRIIEGATAMHSPLPQHLHDGATSGLVQAPMPAECPSAAEQRVALESDHNVTLVAALMDPGRSTRNGHVESAIDEETFWGLVSLLELRVPLVLITQSALLPRLLPLLHPKVRVALVQIGQQGLLQPEAPSEILQTTSQHFGPLEQEPLEMFPFAQEWQEMQNLVSTASRQNDGSGGVDDSDRTDTCNLQSLDSHTLVRKQVRWNQVSWLHWASIINPYSTRHFLW